MSVMADCFKPFCETFPWEKNSLDLYCDLWVTGWVRSESETRAAWIDLDEVNVLEVTTEHETRNPTPEEARQLEAEYRQAVEAGEREYHELVRRTR